jgi:protein-S-isoprenylcysteine O-methyltransferase Ste14
MRIKWGNIPIPEGHVIPFILGIIVQQSIPRTLFRFDWYRSLGIPLVLMGIFLVAWAVRETGAIEVDAPAKLIVTGPYALSRNPMYLAWHLIYAGGIFLVNTGWVALLFTFVLAYTHYRVILREEEELEQLFGREYKVYCAKVRRYF